MMDFNFNGDYRRESFDDQYDEFLKFIGVNMIVRNQYLVSIPRLTIKKQTDPGEWMMSFSSSNLSSIVRFEEGVPVDEQTCDGRCYKTTFVFETETRLIQEQKSIKAGGKDIKLIWDCYSDKLVLQMICEDVISSAVFLRED